MKAPMKRTDLRRVAAAFVTVLALTGCGPSLITIDTPDPEPTQAPDRVEPTIPVGLAFDALNRLEVKGRAPRTGYDRKQFPHWLDLDGNGCDTREDVLARDAIELTTGQDGCVVEVSIADPYTGARVDGKSNIDVDHVVSLSDAWQKGAQQLTRETRVRFANDPLNLLATADEVNASKSDGDAATWLPPDRNAWCPMVARQVAVKERYALWVTQAEHDRIAQILSNCPGETLPSS
jgi:hypothetical protein